MNNIFFKVAHLTLGLLLIVLIIFHISTREKIRTGVKEVFQEDVITIHSSFKLDELDYQKITLTNVRITAFNNDRNQTDSTPNTMASNRIVYTGAVAISSDLRKKYGLKFGDIVYIPELSTYFIFEDGMADGRKKGERVISNTIDVFMFDRKKAKTFRLLNQEVIIYKFSRNQ